ncbi:thioredoxin family protein [Vallitalea okinawensis]|uniref:thioredoxin family protein n=1 Tax=Vallitalea okinawensis TaxID=2078660 RepID=UPI000CFCAAFC|nr:thioredoxin family protein [Vallitalea okinawensis]
MTFLNAKELDELQQIMDSHPLVLLYVTSEDCGVCHAILPRLQNMLVNYEQVTVVKCSLNEGSEITGQYLIMTVPTLCLFFEGKEIFRTSRFIDFAQLERQIKLFSENL